MPGGRPPKLTATVKAKIIQLMRDGNFLSTACGVVGINVETIGYWRRLHESGDKRAKQHAEFFGELKTASNEAEAQALKEIRQGAMNWQSRAWFLERRFGGKYLKPKDRPIKQADQLVDVLAEAMRRAEELRKEREAAREVDADAHGDVANPEG
ncbi:hypothetical protein [Paludisphaera rhizosphaerae]|uniref:hypothetical protein n=1 Tax=Paludisphaera rhizosphaerae TaxID=2711216 RepID=UPI0013ED34FD|nr:hypothetical protein [Paludisphaera rhizosphaerae]